MPVARASRCSVPSARQGQDGLDHDRVCRRRALHRGLAQHSPIEHFAIVLECAEAVKLQQEVRRCQTSTLRNPARARRSQRPEPVPRPPRARGAQRQRRKLKQRALGKKICAVSFHSLSAQRQSGHQLSRVGGHLCVCDHCSEKLFQQFQNNCQ